MVHVLTSDGESVNVAWLFTDELLNWYRHRLFSGTMHVIIYKLHLRVPPRVLHYSLPATMRSGGGKSHSLMSQ